MKWKENGCRLKSKGLEGETSVIKGDGRDIRRDRGLVDHVVSSLHGPGWIWLSYDARRS